MTRITLLALFFAASLCGIQEADAQSSLGVNAGYNLDEQEFFIGGQFRYAPASLPIIFNPSLETYLIDDQTWLRIDVNALYPFGVRNTTFTPYAGAGLGIDYRNFDVGDSQTDAGLNLIFGAEFGMARLRPFAEARIEVGDGTPISLRGGLLLGL